MFQLIGNAQTIAKRIVANNQSAFQAASAAYKKEEVLRLAQSIATEIRSAALHRRLVITTLVAQVFTPQNIGTTSGDIEIVVGNLRRESMMRANGKDRTGSGVDDIVKHFVMGWSWNGRGGGYWHGKRHGFRTHYAGDNFIAPILQRARSSNPDIIITAPAGWE